jgi:hypothetical protein
MLLRFDPFRELDRLTERLFDGRLRRADGDGCSHAFPCTCTGPRPLWGPCQRSHA